MLFLIENKSISIVFQYRTLCVKHGFRLPTNIGSSEYLMDTLHFKGF